MVNDLKKKISEGEGVPQHLLTMTKLFIYTEIPTLK